MQNNNYKQRLKYVTSKVKFLKNITNLSFREVFKPVLFTFVANFLTIGATGMIIMFARTLTDPSTEIPNFLTQVISYLPAKALEGRGALLMIFACIIIAFKMLASGTGYYAKLLTAKIAGVVKLKSSKKVFEKILSKKIIFFDKKLVGEANQLLNRSAQSIPAFITLSQKCLLNILILSVIIGFMLKLSPLLTLASLTIQFLILILTGKFKIYVDKVKREIKKEESALGTNVEVLLANPEIIKSNVTEKYEVVKYEKDLKTAQSTFIKKTVRSELLPLLSEASELFNIFFIAGLIALMRYIDHTSLEIGSAFAFLYLVRTLTVRSSGIMLSITSFIDNFKKLDDVHELFSHTSEDDNDESEKDKIKIDNLNKEILFKETNFSYSTDSKDLNVLKNINIKLTPHKTTAILGKTGSGKSTLAKLLLRLYDCDDETILINNKPINSYNKFNWRSKIAFVPQNSFVLPGTILENIVYGSLEREVTSDAIKLIIKAAQLEEFILKQKKGLNTYIKSETLSHGEKQRIAIARAMLRKADIYIFDEATSAIDPNTEQLILKELKTHLKDKTLIFITHRSAAIKYADYCYYLDKQTARIVKNEHTLDKEILKNYL